MRPALVICAAVLACSGIVWAQASKQPSVSLPPASAAKPELVLQVDHSNPVHALAFSSDGRWLASGGEDNVVKLWEVATGRMLRTLYLGGRVQAVAMSSDRRLLVAASDFHAVKVWDAITGDQLRALPEDSDIECLAISPNGEWLAIVKFGGSVELRDVRTWQVKRTLSLDPSVIEAVTVMAFSQDGRWLALAAGNKIQVLNVVSDQSAFVLGAHTGDVRPARVSTDTVLSLEFSGDGGLLGSASLDQKIKLWDLGARREIQSFASTVFCNVALSRDGRSLAWSSPDHTGQTVTVWDVNARATRRILDSGHWPVSAVAFSPDGNRLALWTPYALELWNLSTGNQEWRSIKSADWVRSLAISSDTHWLAIGTFTDIAIWDLRAGRPTYYWRGNELAMAFAPDASTFAVGSGFREEDGNNNASPNWIQLSELATGNELQKFAGHDSYPVGVGITQDGQRLAAGFTDGTFIVWDVTSGAQQTTIAGNRGPSDLLTVSPAFSPDGNWAVSGGISPATLWNLKTGGPERRLKDSPPNTSSVVFSPDSRVVALGSDDTVKIWELETDKTSELHGISGWVTGLAFSPDGRWLAASASRDKSVKVWDARTGHEENAFVGHTDNVETVQFCPNSSCILTGGEDGTVRIWDRASGDLLAILLSSFQDKSWLVMTPDGLFDGSTDGWKQVQWRFNNNTADVAPAEIFFSEFYHPGLLADIMSGKRPKPATSIARKDRRQPQIALALEGQPGSSTLSSRVVRVKLNVSEARADKKHARGSGARDLRLFSNGSLVKIWHGPIALDVRGTAGFEADVRIVAGVNRLTAYAFNDDNVKSGDAEVTVTGAESLKREGKAYVLAVGINEYADSRFNLKYAVADAQDFAAAVKEYQAKLNEFSEVRVIPLSDAEATKKNILEALNRLSGNATNPKSTAWPHAFDAIDPADPEDAVFIYYAGHGSVPGPEYKRFYLVVHDFQQQLSVLAAGRRNESITGAINDVELGSAIEGIGARQIVLVIDACHSGKALDSEDLRQGPINSKGLAQLAYEKGMYILAAAEGDRAARELSQIGHGLLTYALVEEGLRQGKADDDPADGQILMKEWLDYATARVPQLQLEGMQRMTALGRDVSIVEGEESRHLRDRNLQNPRVFYRRDPDPQPVVIAKP